MRARRRDQTDLDSDDIHRERPATAASINAGTCRHARVERLRAFTKRLIHVRPEIANLREVVEGQRGGRDAQRLGQQPFQNLPTTQVPKIANIGMTDQALRRHLPPRS